MAKRTDLNPSLNLFGKIEVTQTAPKMKISSAPCDDVHVPSVPLAKAA